MTTGFDPADALRGRRSVAPVGPADRPENYRREAALRGDKKFPAKKKKYRRMAKLI